MEPVRGGVWPPAPRLRVCVCVATLRTSQDSGRGDLEFPGVMGQTRLRGPCLLLPHGAADGKFRERFACVLSSLDPSCPSVLTEPPGGPRPHPPAAEEEQRASKCLPDPRPGPAAGASPGGSLRPDPCVPSACRPPGTAGAWTRELPGQCTRACACVSGCGCGFGADVGDLMEPSASVDEEE